MHFERGFDGQNGCDVYFYVSFDGMEDREGVVSKLESTPTSNLDLVKLGK